MEQRLSLITLGVENLQQSLAFYRDGLGWRPSSVGDGEVAFFQLGGIVLGLYGREALAEDAGIPAEGHGFRGIALAYNTRTRDEVDEVLKIAEKAGGRIVKPAKDAFWGGYSGYFADPDGHLWEVAWNPGFTLTDEGNLILPG